MNADARIRSLHIERDEEFRRRLLRTIGNADRAIASAQGRLLRAKGLGAELRAQAAIAAAEARKHRASVKLYEVESRIDAAEHDVYVAARSTAQDGRGH